jgi:hypothetical protein
MRSNHAIVVSAVFAGFLTLLGIAETQASRVAVTVPDRSSSLVIVELFTSEGCSSCPPADALLKKLSEESSAPGVQIIALEEHVDYWDHLGWKDPFSSSTFTERQNDYARKFGNSGTYTPQMIVDGQMEVVGSRSREAREIIQKAAAQPKLAIELSTVASSGAGNVSFDLKITNLSALPNGKAAELWIAITEKNLQSDVKAGENSGERLQHAAIVRSIRKSGTFQGPADYSAHTNLKLDQIWQRNNLSFVVFAVEKNSRKIIGAAFAPLSATNKN